MNELLATIGGLISSLGNVQSASVLKEHLALVNTQLQLLKENAVALQEKNAELMRKNAELEQQIARQQPQHEFVEASGALFKRLTGGGYGETPYCPVCKRTMSSFQNVFPYECLNSNCGHVADFTGNEKKGILDSLTA